MKKLVATLAAVIFCIGAGIEFAGPKEDGFTLSTKEYQSYWSPGDSGELSAADLYRLMYGATDKTKPACNTEVYVPDRYAGDDSIGWNTWHSSPQENVEKYTGYKFSNAQYWFAIKVDDVGHCAEVIGSWQPNGSGQYPIYTQVADGTTAIRSAEWHTRLSVGETCFITAPTNCTLVTSHYSCDYGQTMEVTYNLDGETEVHMVISNAVCWYCCRDKEPTVGSDGTEYYTANTSNSMVGKVFPAGAVLVKADKDTVVSFFRA